MDKQNKKMSNAIVSVDFVTDLICKKSICAVSPVIMSN
jgi:hypothetical protein